VKVVQQAGPPRGPASYALPSRGRDRRGRGGWSRRVGTRLGMGFAVVLLLMAGTLIIDVVAAGRPDGAHLVRVLSLTLGTLTVVLGGAIAFMLTRSIVAPLQQLAAAAKLVANGETNVMIDAGRGDEISALAIAFQSVVLYQANLARAAGAVAGGDLSGQVPLASHRDVLGQAFNIMVTNLQAQTGALVDAESQTRESRARLEANVSRLIEELTPAVNGDLTARPLVSADGGDIAVIADFTGVLIDSFAGVAGLVRHTTSRVQSNSEQLISRVQLLAHEVNERSLQVNEMSAIAGQIGDSATELLTAVEQVNRATQEAVDSVEQGSSAIRQTLARMDTMRATMIQATRQIKKLSDSSLVMNSTVGLVLQFAGDLELLADNAQIEAARHRDTGGVFTAVAEQTGRLAEDAQKALAGIQAAVLANRQETAEVGRQMEQVATEVIANAHAVSAAQAAFVEITDTVGELRGFVGRVHGVAQAQVQVATSVGAAMGQFTTFFRQTAEGVRLSEVDATLLRQTIDALRSSIANLKIAEGAQPNDQAA